MLFLGALLALGVGVTLGMLGGGGSILTLPLLVYVLKVDARAAIATSLLVVGVTSVVGLAAHARKGHVQWSTGLLLGGSGMAGAALGARVARHLPETVLLIGFAAVMLVTAARMLLGKKQEAPRRRAGAITRVAIGGSIGVVSGLVGAGGGFLIVPALVTFAGLPMREAVATSLLVIAMQAFAGFAGHVGHVALDPTLTTVVTAATAVGGLLGARFSTRVDAAALKRGFGVLVLLTAIGMLLKQAPRGLLQRPEAPLLAIALAAILLTLAVARRAQRG